MLLTLAACGKNGQLRSDVTVADLSAAVEPLIVNASHLDTADDDYLRFNRMAPRARRAASTFVNQRHHRWTNTASSVPPRPRTPARWQMPVRLICQKRNDAWMHTYMVEEYPKLRDAEVKVIGQYVVYLILTEAEKEAVTGKDYGNAEMKSK